MKREGVSIVEFEGMQPQIDESVFIAPGARIIGDVVIGENSSIWFNVVIRGDVHSIHIGSGTNIQDLTMCHVTNQKYALRIGNDVTVGHSAVLHGATIEDRVLIGMGAIVLDNARIGAESIVAAGTVVREGMDVPPGSLVAGVPGRIVRLLTEEERSGMGNGSSNYMKYVERYRSSGCDW